MSGSASSLENLACFSLLVVVAATPAFGAVLDVPSEYPTIQAAVRAASPSDTIRIARGRYDEPVTVPSGLNYVTFRGLDRNGVVLQAGRGATALTVHGANVSFENMTIQNTFQSGSETSHAVYVDSPRVQFYRCSLIGYQDTLAIWDHAVVSCRLSEVQGEEDFIYGGGTAFFSSCIIREVNARGCDLTAPSTPVVVTYGFVFSHCSILGAPRVALQGTGLMRPWGAYGETVYLDCAMDRLISLAGWDRWGGREITCRAAEFGTTTLSGSPVDLSTRAPWAKRLTPAQAAIYSEGNVLGGWTPRP